MYKDENDEMKETSIEEQKEFDKAEEDAKRILKMFHRAKVAIGDRNSEQMENMAFYEGKQYQLSRYKVTRPWVVRMRTPYASVAIDTRVASLIASDYEGVLMPMNAKDEKTVNELNNFLRDEWERLDMDTKVGRAIKTSAIVREDYVHISWDSEARDGAGQAEATVIGMPSAVYIDPAALDLRDARFVQILARKTIEEAREMYPKFEKALFAGRGGFNSEDRGEVYLGKDYTIEQDNVCTILTHYEKTSKGIKRCTVVENILVDEVLLDGLKSFPIAQMRWKRASGSPYGLALMDSLIDLQKSVNSIDSTIVNTAVAYSAPTYGLRKGCGVEAEDLAEANGAPGLILTIEGNIDEAIKPIALPKLDAAIINVKNENVAAIDQIAGITNPYLGSIGTAGNTAQGSKMALERARIIEAEVLENIQTFVEDLVCILMEYITTQYSGEEVTSRKVDRPSKKVKFETYKFGDEIEDLDYTFYINLSSKTPYSKEREKEKVVELFQMENQYKAPIKLFNQLDILEAYDMENQDVLIERYGKLLQQSDETKTQIVMQLIKQAMQLQVPDEMLQPAIIEVISGSEETPVLDKLTAYMQQKASEVAAKKEEALASFSQNVQAAGVAPNAITSMMQQGQNPGGGMPPVM